MSSKPQPNRQRYLEVLRSMTPQQKLAKAFELTELARSLLRAGLRQQFPELSEEELHQVYLERLAKCRDPKNDSVDVSFYLSWNARQSQGRIEAPQHTNSNG